MKYELEQAVNSACQELFNVYDAAVVLTRPEEKFGDYTTNVALRLARKLHKNPREVAESLAEKLHNDLGNRVKAVTVAGPGFINITLTDQALMEAAVQASRGLNQ